MTPIFDVLNYPWWQSEESEVPVNPDEELISRIDEVQEDQQELYRYTNNLEKLLAQKSEEIDALKLITRKLMANLHELRESNQALANEVKNQRKEFSEKFTQIENQIGELTDLMSNLKLEN